MFKFKLLSGGEIIVPASSIKNLSFNGVNVELLYTDLEVEVLLYESLYELGIRYINTV